MNIKFLLILLFLMPAVGHLFAQDTTTVLIYDTTSHSYKRVNLAKYENEQRKLTRKIITDQIEDEAIKVTDTKRKKMYKITRKGDYKYNYNYGDTLRPVTPLTFYYKAIEDTIIPPDVSAHDWLNMSKRRQKKMLRKQSRKR